MTNVATHYDQLVPLFTAKNGRELPRKKLANNTYLERRGEDLLAVRLHKTDILTIDPLDHVRLDSGGWLTVTTKARLNDYLPNGLKVWSDKGRWYVYRYDKQISPFFDGIILTPGGRVLNEDSAPDVEDQDEHNRRARKAISEYVDGLTPERLAYVLDRDYQVVVGEGKPTAHSVGVIVKDDARLLEYIESRRYSAELLKLAIEEKGYANPAFHLQIARSDAKHGSVSFSVPHSLKSYLRKRLLKGVATK